MLGMRKWTREKYTKTREQIEVKHLCRKLAATTEIIQFYLPDSFQYISVRKRLNFIWKVSVLQCFNSFLIKSISLDDPDDKIPILEFSLHSIQIWIFSGGKSLKSVFKQMYSINIIQCYYTHVQARLNHNRRRDYSCFILGFLF